ncbi:MAG: hypothetical protein ACJ77G_04175 [Solirubrobacteraceae bacterium]
MKCTLLGAIIAIVCCHKGLRRRRGRRSCGQPGRGDCLPGSICVQLRVHPDPVGDPS